MRRPCLFLFRLIAFSGLVFSSHSVPCGKELRQQLTSMAPERNPTETSPLLAASNGTAPTGAIIDRRDAESGELDESADEQVKEPFHDAQKQLKYIVPAISIGVCYLSSGSERFSKNPHPSGHPWLMHRCRYSCRRQTRPLLWLVMARLGVT